MARIKKDNTYFDLYDDFKPFLKLQANDMGTIAKRRASYSVDFKIPWTTNNVVLLDNIGESNGNSSANQRIENIYLEFETVDYQGFLRVVKAVPNRYYEVSFLTDLADWTDLMKDSVLRGLNLDEYEHNYTTTNIVNSFSNTEGYIYPIVNYGYWNNILQSFILSSRLIPDTRYSEYFPAVYDSTILKQCFKDIGWNVEDASEI